MTVTLSYWGKASYFFINGSLPDDVRETMDRELSYEVPDAQWTDAWKTGEWDGRHRLLRESKNGNLYFPVGLLGKVTKILDLHGVDYEVEGFSRPGQGDMGYEWDTDMALREYQESAVNECLSNGGGVVVMPTGSGKTVVGLRVIKEIDRPTIVFCHRTEIADQWAEQIESILGVEPARFYGGDHEEGPIMVALYQSLYEEATGGVREGVRIDHDVAIFDETHRIAADTFETVAMGADAPWRVGLTATPDREDNAQLRIIGGAGPMIADLSVEKLIEQGYLAEPDWEIYESPSASGAYQNWQAEYAGEIVENGARNANIAEVVDGLDKPVMVTVERVNHGERLAGLMDEAVFVHGSDSERERKISDFREGDIDVLIATRGIVGEGFDVPEIRSFVVAGGMKSSTSMIQQVGRALRPGEHGEATIVDFIDKGEWVGDHSEQRIRTYQDYYGEYGP